MTFKTASVKILIRCDEDYCYNRKNRHLYCGHLMSKRSSDPGEWQYFDTWSEARQFLIDREKTKIRALCDELDKHETTLRKLQEMNQP